MRRHPDHLDACRRATGAPKSRRRWFQYSLRSMLLLMLLVSIPMGRLAVKLQGARRQREAAVEIRRIGGVVSEGWVPRPASRPGDQQLHKSTWLEKVLGEDLSVTVRIVRLPGSATDVELRSVRWLPGLVELELAGTKITDMGLSQIEGCTGLDTLDLSGTLVTDSGLVHLEGLTEIQILNLSRTDITDEGLEHIKGLTRLSELDLEGTKVTDAGLECLDGLAEMSALSA